MQEGRYGNRGAGSRFVRRERCRRATARNVGHTPTHTRAMKTIHILYVILFDYSLVGKVDQPSPIGVGRVLCVPSRNLGVRHFFGSTIDARRDELCGERTGQPQLHTPSGGVRSKAPTMFGNKRDDGTETRFCLDSTCTRGPWQLRADEATPCLWHITATDGETWQVAAAEPVCPCCGGELARHPEGTGEALGTEDNPFVSFLRTLNKAKATGV